MGDKHQHSQSFRILIQTSSGFVETKFNDCILELLQFENEGGVNFYVKDNSVYLRECTGSSILIKHSPICPFMQKDTTFLVNENANANSKVLLAVAVLVQSSDGLILLNKRPLHMRTFPGMWVVPGGHVDNGESLHEAIIRELLEETGLHIDLNCDKLSVMAMWESSYPPFGQQPIRHHLIIYFHCKMMKNYSELQNNIKLEVDEVSISLWLNLPQLKALLDKDFKTLNQISPHISVTEVNETKMQIITEKKIEDLFSYENYSYEGRIPAGTNFALQQLIKKMETEKMIGHSNL